MKCDELKVYKVYTTRNEGAFGFCEGADPIDIELEHEPVCLKSDVDKVIAELKEKLHDVDNQWNEQCKEIAQLKATAEEREKEIEFMHSNCKWHAGDGCDRLHGELMAAVGNVGELKAEIESLKASHYAEMVDAGMRERRLCRTLWLARALRARDIQRWWLSVTLAPITERACRVWNDIEIKCLKKAEEYK